ncbi:hypothetical protein [Lysobacter enzymogenes]|uniref:hypothetical protein n=1 Tax=Lysobacter enzymogenes TaxID=69 RepID=UPI0019CF6D7C|nr:hypothetical protein [Lysobacter enzymogenes]
MPRWLAKRSGSVSTPRNALFLGRDGRPLSKAGFDTMWQRFIRLAINEGAITEAQRFSPHDLKRKGVTDTRGTKATKQDAAGLSEGMMKVYDNSVPLVEPSAK